MWTLASRAPDWASIESVCSKVAVALGLVIKPESELQCPNFLKVLLASADSYFTERRLCCFESFGLELGGGFADRVIVLFSILVVWTCLLGMAPSLLADLDSFLKEP